MIIRVADFFHRLFKLAIKRWYVTLILLLIFASPVLMTVWKVHKFQKAIAQLKMDNPQGSVMSSVSISYFSDKKNNARSLVDFGSLNDINSFRNIISRDDLCIFFDNGSRAYGLGSSRNSAAVSDISALKGMSLVLLDLSPTQVIDISALKGMPLTELSLPKTAKNIEWLKGMKTLNYINQIPVVEFWKEYDAKK